MDKDNQESKGLHKIDHIDSNERFLWREKDEERRTIESSSFYKDANDPVVQWLIT